MKNGYSKLVLVGLIIVVVILLGIFIIEPISDLFERITKALEGISP